MGIIQVLLKSCSPCNLLNEQETSVVSPFFISGERENATSLFLPIEKKGCVCRYVQICMTDK